MKHRLPAVAGHTQIAEAGVMMAYGPNRIDLYRRAAGFVDKILKGAAEAVSYGLRIRLPSYSCPVS